jgi:hypothetical protein
MSDVIAQKLSKTISETEVKLTNGISINGKYEDFKSNLGIKNKDIIIVKSKLTKQYKQKINKLHNEKCI